MPQPTPTTAPAASRFAWKWLWVWLMAFPVAGVLLYGYVAVTPYPFLLPYLAAALLLLIPCLALLSGAITRSFKATLLGTILGLPLALEGAILISNYRDKVADARWNAEYDEFRTFGSVVLAGDPGKVATGLRSLKHFSSAEAMCVLRAGRGGGLGYWLPDGPEVADAGEKLRNYQPYVVPTERLYLVAEAIVAGPDKAHEKQLALFQLLQALAEREEEPDMGRWTGLWNHVTAVPITRAGMAMTESRLADYCNNDIDLARSAKLLLRITKRRPES